MLCLAHISKEIRRHLIAPLCKCKLLPKASTEDRLASVRDYTALCFTLDPETRIVTGLQSGAGEH
jgi:hypothetical protein